MNILVTGGAGFIGSHLVDRLISMGHKISCIDNLILGSMKNLAKAQRSKNFKFFKIDILDKQKLYGLFEAGEFDVVYHLAANSDVKEGAISNDRDLNLTFLTTFNILDSMVKHNVNKIVFTSTGAVFGKSSVSLKESSSIDPESFYGASKHASEVFINTFSKLYGIQSWIVRPANIIGERATHGVIYDFINKLELNKKELEILGDGNQSKPYLYVQELIDAIVFIVENSSDRVNVYNVGPPNQTKVSEIANILLDEMGEKRRIRYTGGVAGWKGDVPLYSYDSSKLEDLGWKPRFSSTQAVRFSIQKMIKHSYKKV